jgi:hypothetical protein
MEIANIQTRSDGTADYAVALKKTPPFAGALKRGMEDRAGDLQRPARSTPPSRARTTRLIVALAEGHHRTRRGVYDLLLSRAEGLRTRRAQSAPRSACINQ